MPNVLITPAPLRRQPGTFRDLLLAAGFKPIDAEGQNTLTTPELLRFLPEADAMLAGSELLDASALDQAPRLRVIARTGVGYDAVDVAAATARKIPLTITPGTNHESVAEQAFALILGFCRRIALNDAIIRRGGWDRTTVEPVRGKTLGLVGLGRIGRAMVPRALAFGLRVVAFDPVGDAETDRRLGVERASLEDLLAASDIVSLHMPLVPATRGLFNRDAFARMRPGAFLINTSRGGLVVESDLYEALRSGHLGGAGLDVLDPEPPDSSNPLLSLPNVVISPHMGGVDARSMADMAEKAAQCVVDLYEGRWPAECVVNGELEQGWKW